MINIDIVVNSIDLEEIVLVRHQVPLNYQNKLNKNNHQCTVSEQHPPSTSHFYLIYLYIINYPSS